jgi:hypothetical protein
MKKKLVAVGEEEKNYETKNSRSTLTVLTLLFTSFSKIICNIVASLNLRPFLAFSHGNSSLSYAHRAK